MKPMFQNYQILRYLFIAILCAKLSCMTWALMKYSVCHWWCRKLWKTIDHIENMDSSKFTRLLQNRRQDPLPLILTVVHWSQSFSIFIPNIEMEKNYHAENRYSYVCILNNSIYIKDKNILFMENDTGYTIVGKEKWCYKCFCHAADARAIKAISSWKTDIQCYLRVLLICSLSN